MKNNLNKIKPQKLEPNHKTSELESAPQTNLTKLKISELESIMGGAHGGNWWLK
ncbi:MAG: hypothetical protein F6J90_34770 [Moorea sp. SIOASIH]|uniref:hypothetical protein n=1 Tax=Moorena sp. SIOASIH TaxID=2607817 RepID=UPI0013B96F99|nr:hypothetical protein [Moorena sp. SIOASIH]NEO41214.1 hypothetical protein [Moorena sp. SIOASIH]